MAVKVHKVNEYDVECDECYPRKTVIRGNMTKLP